MSFRRALWSAIFFLAAVGFVWTEAAETIVIVHTNDIHGQILARDGVGGMAELATLIRRAKPDLVLDGGDMFTGTMISDETKGKPLIEIMNRLNYTAVALGNHEFDYGIQAFNERAQEARFPVLSANVTGLEKVHPYTIVKVHDSRIGIIGLTVEDLVHLTHPKNLKGITVKAVVGALEETIPKVRTQTDFIIL